MAEPIDLATAKQRLGIRTDFRDLEITGLIAAARAQVEHLTDLILVQRPVRVPFPYFPRADYTGAGSLADTGSYLGGGYGSYAAARHGLEIPFRPVRALTALSYLDSAGVRQQIADARLVGAEDFEFRLPRVFPAPSTYWPAAGDPPDVVAVLDAGFDPPGVAGDYPFPPDGLTAMLLLVGHWFENHEPVPLAARNIAEMPHGVSDICERLRIPSPA